MFHICIQLLKIDPQQEKGYEAWGVCYQCIVKRTDCF